MGQVDPKLLVTLGAFITIPRMLLTVLIAIESNVKRLRLEDLANAGSTHPLVDVLCRREIKKVLCSDDEGSDKTALRDEVVSRRVREFGSARDGLREGRLQRLTAIAVIPLSLHFAASILSLATSGRKTAADWLSLPVLALVVILVVLAGIMHALIGVGSVVLDYVHTRTRSW